MNDVEFWLKYCRDQMLTIDDEIAREPFAMVREEKRKRKANYIKWISQYEAILGVQTAA